MKKFLISLFKSAFKDLAKEFIRDAIDQRISALVFSRNSTNFKRSIEEIKVLDHRIQMLKDVSLSITSKIED